MLAPREVDEYVLPTERRVIRFRRHWAVIVGEVLQAVILFVLLALGAAFLPQNVVLDNLFWYGALLVLLKSSYKVSEWWVEKVVVTDKRVMLTKGIFTHNVGMMPLTKVTDLSFIRTFNGRLLGYGTMVIESAGQIQALNQIHYLPDPEEVYEAISELVFGDKRQTRSYTLPGSGFGGARGRRR
ncbi:MULTISPECIES: PH domain-containing protein [Actinomycetospora]|uniref:PH domain-containing protein n=1 Tax=Actinomycetospora chibensis TaxID=663606 RepID=A0ABV9RFA7_9PSEU|nr:MULTISPECIES: PH domain-containing protein [Actinomycetospora]MDD7917394.1 PH domain-containing protein [Actinomycetospora callitridis]MDD7923483.1 PH domain-containing protein [Actinomycetospora chibensis]